MKACTNHKPEECIASHFEEASQWRRQLHRNPQPAWLEFYSTGFVAEKLSDWGYKLQLGKEIIDESKRLVVPDEATLQAEYNRALRAGIDEQFITPAKGGFTGVVGILKGARPGPTVAFRFDIDSLEILESNDPSHPPVAGGYVSQNQGYAHMCGHDAHTALGLLLARHFAENQDKVKGTVKLIFQPNEENLGGAVTMVPMGVVDDADYLFGAHVGINVIETGKIGLNVFDWLAMNRFEVTYTGRASHAAVRPDLGKNALLGACAAITNLYAISRHGTGASRINVGVMQAGTTWNIIPEKAYFRMETRGVTNEINEYMIDKAMDVLHGAAKMYDLGLEIRPAASTVAAVNSPELIELGNKVANALSSVKEIVPVCSTNGSEDICVFMQRVQQRGGKAMAILLGTPIGGGHHSNRFDVDDKVMQNGAEFFAAMYDAVTDGLSKSVSGGHDASAQLRMGEEFEGHEVAIILGQSATAEVYTTVDKQLRWRYLADDGRVPSNKNSGLSLFEAIMAEIKTDVPPRDKDAAYQQLGKALFHALDSNEPEKYEQHFTHVQKFVDQCVLRDTRRKYVAAFLVSATITGAGSICAAFLTKGSAVNEYLWASACGVAGSVISVFYRSGTLALDPKAGQGFLIFQGACRPILGMLFATFVVVACKGDIGLSFAKDRPFALMTMALIAGFSERFVPEIMTRLEGAP